MNKTCPVSSRRLPLAWADITAGESNIANNETTARTTCSLKSRHRNEALLYSCGEGGLKMRALLLACDDTHFNCAEGVFFQKLMQLDFAKAEPVVRIQFASPFEAM